MPKLNRRFYFTESGERKLNCYQIIIKKEEVIKAGFDEKDDLEVIGTNGKIIIKKK